MMPTSFHMETMADGKSTEPREKLDRVIMAF
jgi:hypothetical protein